MDIFDLFWIIPLGMAMLFTLGTELVCSYIEDKEKKPKQIETACRKIEAELGLSPYPFGPFNAPYPEPEPVMSIQEEIDEREQFLNCTFNTLPKRHEGSVEVDGDYKLGDYIHYRKRGGYKEIY